MIWLGTNWVEIVSWALLQSSQALKDSAKLKWQMIMTSEQFMYVMMLAPIWHIKGLSPDIMLAVLFTLTCLNINNLNVCECLAPSALQGYLYTLIQNGHSIRNER